MNNKLLGRQINKFVKIAPNRLNEIRYELLNNNIKRHYGPYMFKNNLQAIECREVHTQQ